MEKVSVARLINQAFYEAWSISRATDNQSQEQNFAFFAKSSLRSLRETVGTPQKNFGRCELHLPSLLINTTKNEI